MHRIVTATSTLVSLCLVLGCSPESGESQSGGASESADPDILPDDPTTGETDPTEPESSGSGSDSDSTGDEQQVFYPECADRNPQLSGLLDFDFGPWGGPASAPSGQISAECFTTDFQWDGYTAYFEMRCSAGDLVDQVVSATMNLGPQPGLEMPLGYKVMFSGGWDNNPAEGSPYQYFIIHDEASFEVHVAGLLNIIEGANDLLGSLKLGLKYEMCPWECASDCADGGVPAQRAAVVVHHAENNSSIEVLDGNRGALPLAESTYEVVAGRLVELRDNDSTELDSAIVIAGQPIY